MQQESGGYVQNIKSIRKKIDILNLGGGGGSYFGGVGGGGLDLG